MTDQAAQPAPVVDLSKLNIDQLCTIQGEAQAEADKSKASLAAIQLELQSRFGASAKAALQQLGKEHGQTKLPLQGGVEAAVKIDKEVKWDSAKLLAVAQTLPWERVVAIFKIGFEVSETIYKGIAAVAPDLKTKIDDARTVVIKEPKIVLQRADG